jgi:uncharacterized membrane protein
MALWDKAAKSAMQEPHTPPLCFVSQHFWVKYFEDLASFLEAHVGCVNQR